MRFVSCVGTVLGSVHHLFFSAWISNAESLNMRKYLATPNMKNAKKLIQAKTCGSEVSNYSGKPRDACGVDNTNNVPQQKHTDLRIF